MLNVHAFPQVERLFNACVEYSADLAHEANANFERGYFLPWPEKINSQELWRVFGVKWGDKLFNAESLPVLHRLVTEAGALVTNAGYSAMLPGARITPHEGYTKDVLRFHFGLVCPHGDCQISIDGSHYKWHQKTGLLFDDTLSHEAWNNTDRVRIVLLFDLKKVCL